MCFITETPYWLGPPNVSGMLPSRTSPVQSEVPSAKPLERAEEEVRPSEQCREKEDVTTGEAWDYLVEVDSFSASGTVNVMLCEEYCVPSSEMK